MHVEYATAYSNERVLGALCGDHVFEICVSTVCSDIT